MICRILYLWQLQHRTWRLHIPMYLDICLVSAGVSMATSGAEAPNAAGMPKVTHTTYWAGRWWWLLNTVASSCQSASASGGSHLAIIYNLQSPRSSIVQSSAPHPYEKSTCDSRTLIVRVAYGKQHCHRIHICFGIWKPQDECGKQDLHKLNAIIIGVTQAARGTSQKHNSCVSKCMHMQFAILTQPGMHHLQLQHRSISCVLNTASLTTPMTHNEQLMTLTTIATILTTLTTNG